MTSPERVQQLLKILRAADAPVSGEHLATVLGVSTRSVRQFVRDVNAQAGETLVLADRSGYVLDAGADARFQGTAAATPRSYQSPQQRQLAIARRLVEASAGLDVYGLAADLFISDATLEVDLGRVREMLRDFDLVLRRDHDRITLEGSERQRRRLLRHVLLFSSEGFTPAALDAFAAQYSDYDLRDLHAELVRAVEQLPTEVNEFVMTDVILHLTVAADRVRQGHTVDPAPIRDGADPIVETATRAIAEALHRSFGVELPPGELRALQALLATRLTKSAGDILVAGSVIDARTLELVQDAIAELADEYQLHFTNDDATLNLALHVQNLLARAKSGQILRAPMGAAFKTQHPLIYELALRFVQHIEAGTGIRVADGELDFVAYHLGSQLLRQLELTNKPTITVVAPRYHDTAKLVTERIREAVAGQAVIDEVITSLEYDWSSIDSDLVVTAVPLSGRVQGPTIEISPLASSEDLDRVQQAVRRERRRAELRRIRTSFAALIDRDLYIHQPEVASQEEALAQLCGRLQAQGVVHDDFYRDVLDRERRSSTAFNGPFAIPHSMRMDANRTALAVLATDRPIPWGDSAVRLVILFAFSPDGRSLFREVMDKLIGFLAEPATSTRLINHSGSHEDFINELSRLLEA